MSSSSSSSKELKPNHQWKKKKHLDERFVKYCTAAYCWSSTRAKDQTTGRVSVSGEAKLSEPCQLPLLLLTKGTIFTGIYNRQGATETHSTSSPAGIFLPSSLPLPLDMKNLLIYRSVRNRCLRPTGECGHDCWALKGLSGAIAAAQALSNLLLSLCVCLSTAAWGWQAVKHFSLQLLSLPSFSIDACNIGVSGGRDFWWHRTAIGCLLRE